MSGSTSIPFSGGFASRSPEPPSSQWSPRDARRLGRGLDARRDGRPTGGRVEERQLVGPVAEDGDAECLERLGGCGNVEERLGAGADDERLRARELGQVGRDVGALREAAVHAADPAGAHEADPAEPADRERPADGGRPDRALRGAGSEVARPGLEGFQARLAEPLELPVVQADDRPPRRAPRPLRARLLRT